MRRSAGAAKVGSVRIGVISVLHHRIFMDAEHGPAVDNSSVIEGSAESEI
jgi:hypothetical protein